MMTSKRFVGFVALGFFAMVGTGMAGVRSRDFSTADAMDAEESIVPGAVDDTGTFLVGGEAQEAGNSQIDPAFIPPNGLSIYNDGYGFEKSHTPGNQLCRLYRTVQEFDANHAAVLGKPCVGNDCSEDFEGGTNGGAGITICTAGVPLNCTAGNACMALGAVNRGLEIQEVDLSRPATGLLQGGPGWFGNRPAPTGKFVLNNFFNDALEMRFTGNPGFPVACNGPVPPRVVGFDTHNHLNAATNTNTVTVTLASGNQFIYTTQGSNSGKFSGVCCSEDIRTIRIQNIGNFTEGVDNVRYGTSGGCATPENPVTNDVLHDAMEALEMKMDNFQCTGGPSSM